MLNADDLDDGSPHPYACKVFQLLCFDPDAEPLFLILSWQVDGFIVLAIIPFDAIETPFQLLEDNCARNSKVRCPLRTSFRKKEKHEANRCSKESPRHALVLDRVRRRKIRFSRESFISLVCNERAASCRNYITKRYLTSGLRYIKFEQFKFEIIMRTTKRYGKKIDLALSVWVKLTRAYMTFHKLSDENIRSFGLTGPQFSVIESLGHLGPLTTGVLCKKQLVSGGNMTVVIDNLQKEGLVERIPSTEDRRAITIRLTPRGKRLFDEIFPKHAEYIAKLTSVLQEEEQAKLAELLKKLGTSLAASF